MHPDEETLILARTFNAFERMATAITHLPPDERLRVLQAGADIAEAAVLQSRWQLTWNPDTKHLADER